MVPGLYVRKASHQDVRAVAAIKATSWRSTYADWVPKRILERLAGEEAVMADLEPLITSRDAVLLVASVEGTVVGFALAVPGSGDVPLLESFHVLPSARGRGVGAALLRQLAETLDKHGATALDVHVVEQNLRTLALYERLGAVRTTRVPAGWAPDDVVEVHLRWPTIRALRDA